MLFTAKEDLKLIKELKLTPNQLLFVKILVRDFSIEESVWRKQCYANALEFQTMKFLSKEEFLDLIKREILLDFNRPGDPFFYDCIELNPKYLRKFVLQVTGMPTELCDAYPYQLTVGTTTFFARDVGPEVISQTYLKNINKSVEEHERVLDDIRWAIENKVLATGLKKFVESKFWIHIRTLRIKPTLKPVNNGTLG